MSKVAGETNITVGDITDLSMKLLSDNACSLYNFFNCKVEQHS